MKGKKKKLFPNAERILNQIKQEDKMSKHKEATAEEPSESFKEGATKTKKEKKVRVTMASAWGEVFSQAANENQDQAWVEQEMLARFPEKEETIRKWTPWYKNFYNMGKIKGFENPVKVTWQSEAQLKRAEEKEAKAQAKAEAKAQKEADRAQKKAEKGSKKEAVTE